MTNMASNLDTAVEYYEPAPELRIASPEPEIKKTSNEVIDLKEKAEDLLQEILKKAEFKDGQWYFYETESKEKKISDTEKIREIATKLHHLLNIKSVETSDPKLKKQIKEQIEALEGLTDKNTIKEVQDKIRERAEKEHSGLLDKLREIGRYLIEKAKGVLKLAFKLLMNPWIVLAILVITSPFLIQGAVYLYQIHLNGLLSSAGAVIKTTIDTLPTGIVKGIEKAAVIISEIITKVFGGKTPLPVPA